MTRVVVADDEPHVRQHLLTLLSSVWPLHGAGKFDLVGEAEDGEQALKLVDELKPDIAFLDIRMPELSGLEVAHRLAAQNSSCTTLLVFVTAFDDHAIEAFEASAVDYLLKPLQRNRLTVTVERLAARLGQQAAAGQTAAKPYSAAQIDRLLEQIDGLSNQSPPRTLKWLRATRGDETELVPVDDVVYFKAGHKYVSALTADQEHVLRLSLKELTRQLDGEKFWQIHRALVVNVSQIKSARRDLRGRYVLSLHDRPETLRTSLAYADLFKSM